MQEPRPELNQRLLGALLCAAGGGGALLWARGPQLGAGPLPQGYPSGSTGAASEMAVVAGAAAAGAVAVLFLLLRSRARSGAFAALFGGALAAGLPLLGEPWLGSGSATWLAPASALLGVMALPLFRERGLLSLCLVPAIAVQPALWARQAVMAQAYAVVPLRTLQKSAPLSGQLGLVVPEGTDPALVRAFVQGLRRPCFPFDLDVWPVGDTLQAEWLLRSGAPLLRLREGRADLQMPAARQRQDLALRVEVVLLAAAGGLQVRAGDRAAGGTFAVFTPWGCLTGGLDDEGTGMLDGNAWKALIGSGDEPHTGMRIRVLAVSRGADAAYGAADLCLP